MKNLPTFTFVVLTFAAVFFAGVQKSTAAEQTLEEVANKYISMYPIDNIDELTQFYTDETVWQDPRHLPGKKLVGRDEITKMMREFAGDENVRAFSFEPSLDYIVGDTAIFKYKMGIEFRYDNKLFKTENVDGIAVVRIVDGKVLEHSDFTNINQFNKNLKQLEE